MTIDSSGSEEFLKDEVDRAAMKGSRFFVIDGSEITYADSAGLGELVRAYTRIQREGGKLVFAVPLVHHLRSRFRLTKLDRELTLYPDVDEAVHALQDAAPNP